MLFSCRKLAKFKIAKEMRQSLRSESKRFGDDHTPFEGVFLELFEIDVAADLPDIE